ncbi:DUF515 domain-containing protein [Methanococcus voltae]|uniref:Uncharacterized protein n=1 Tax=Methanococcus voltae (strain ATCC BAA-1334 / A3) TaxID=456320 RepID=D7DUR5_METV3|nr:DUF515 domain-containing protein [Methanococcus voltae]MCS3900677.1 hypothetical protein [Methanococcus voltae]
MSAEEYSDKVKSLKSKSKKSSRIYYRHLRSVLILALITVIIVSSYYIYTNIKAEDQVRLEQTKESSMVTVNNLFEAYPSDHRRLSFIAKIQNSQSISEVNDVVDEATDYIQVKEYKDSSIGQIIAMYGSYYDYSSRAPELVRKIQSANSIAEIDEYFSTIDIKSEITTVLNSYVDYQLSSGDEYYYVKTKTTKIFINRDNLQKYVESLNLGSLDGFSITSVKGMDKVTIMLTSDQCGKLPEVGEFIKIYSKNDTNFLTYAIVDNSYMALSNLEYSETKMVSSAVEDDGNKDTLESSSSVSYSLDNVPGILHATVAGKLDYSSVSSKFSSYGQKLNEIEEKTQIFDDNVNYVLIVSIPSEQIPLLISKDSEELVIVRTLGGLDEV